METITNSAILFTAVFLFSCSFLIICMTVLLINNLIYKYWKNVGWTIFANSYQESLKLNEAEPKLEPKLKESNDGNNRQA